jgi:hypothetical protein
VYLAASLLALVLGPLIVRLAGAARGVVTLLDGFVVVTVGGVVFIDVLPEALHMAGWSAAAAAVLGLLLPAWIERRLLHRGSHERETWIVLLPALVAIAIHAFFDGAVLAEAATSGGGDDALLGLGVVLHNIPVGLAIWWPVRAAHGGGVALAILGVLAAATSGGYGYGQARLADVPLDLVAIVQALVAGSLVHVVLHFEAPAPDLGRRAHRAWAAFGALAGAGALALLHRVEGEAGAGPVAPGEHAAVTFLDLTLETAPALLVAFVGAGLLHGLLTAGSVRWLGRGGPTLQAVRGMVFGLPLPICSCGVLPVYRSLVVSGAPPAAAVAFLVAAPEIGLDAFLVSLPLLGAPLAVVRLACAAFVAVAVALLWARFIGSDAVPASGDAARDGTTADVPLPRRMAAGLRYGLNDLVDHTLPWVLVGLAVAAALDPLLDPGSFTALPAGLDVPVMALVGMPVYVCASGATPLVAVLLAKGLSPGAAIAFLLTGPATNVTTFGVLSRLHGARAAALFAVAMGGVAVATGLAVNVLFAGEVFVPPVGDVTDVHPVWRIAALAALSLLFLWSLLRRGPRGLIDQLLSREGVHKHAGGQGDADAHTHANGHAHAPPRDPCCAHDD